MNMQEINKQLENLDITEITRPFRDEWALAVNDKDNKPYKDKMYGTKYHGKLYGVHYVVYNIVRGLPIERGFIKGSDKLEAHLRYIAMKVQWDKLADLLFPFNDTISTDEFKEKYSEAIRLYSCS